MVTSELYTGFVDSSDDEDPSLQSNIKIKVWYGRAIQAKPHLHFKIFI